MKLFSRRRQRMAEARRESENSVRIGRMLERQWPEVQHLTEFARNQRQMNHLTQLFMTGRGK